MGKRAHPTPTPRPCGKLSPVEPDADTTGEGAADAAYRWVIRGAYLVLIAANIYVVWDMYAETVPALVLRARVKSWVERVQNCEGCARRREALARATNRMIYAATEIVEEAAAEPKEAE